MNYFEELVSKAISSARSVSSGDLPIAAIILDSSGSIVADFQNAVRQSGSVAAHAEIRALASLDLKFLKSEASRMTLVVTLEPCPMCAWAIRSAGIGRLIFGAYNSLYGAAGSVYDLLRDSGRGRAVEVFGGILIDECEALLGNAFREMR